MTYLFLILFFTSLAALIFMIGKKLAKLEQHKVLDHEEVMLEIPYLKDIKRLTAQGVRKAGHTLLVSTLRFYIRTTNFLKDKHGKIKTRIQNIYVRSNATGDRKEISKFLKIIGDYKRKIREIKHRIKREEDL